MEEKNKFNKKYDEGYEDGKKGGLFDDVIQKHKNIIPLPDSKEEKSYDEGYNDGKEDRGDDDNSNYHGGTSENNSNCFLSTACVISKGLPDNCNELKVLRDFRDNYVIKQPNGEKYIKEYYRIAPKIIRAINENINSKIIYDKIYIELNTSVNFIIRGENERAFDNYYKLINDLSNQFTNKYK